MNPLKMLGNLGSQQPNGNNLLMQAFGAMMRGESPQAFMQNLAKTNPMLSGMDFSNLEQSARQICKEKNVDVEEKIKELKLNLPK